MLPPRGGGWRGCEIFASRAEVHGKYPLIILDDREKKSQVGVLLNKTMARPYVVIFCSMAGTHEV